MQHTAEEIRSEIKRMIAEVTERTPEEVGDTAQFVDELGVDSLMAIEVMVAVDKKFKIDIPEEEFMTVKTVNDTVAMVQRYLENGAATAAV